jgi:hypothetical protein
MYRWKPQIDLDGIRDHLDNTATGYSFVTDMASGLSGSYLELSRRASLSSVNGLMADDDEDDQAVRWYLNLYSQMSELTMSRLHLPRGQAPRETELSALGYREFEAPPCNAPDAS